MSILLDALKKAEEENKARTSSKGLLSGEASLDAEESLENFAQQEYFFKVNKDVALPKNSDLALKQFWVLLGFSGLILVAVALFFGQKKSIENKANLEALASNVRTIEEKSPPLSLLKNQNTAPVEKITNQNTQALQEAELSNSQAKQSNIKINQPTLKEEYLAEPDNTPTPASIHEAKKTVEEISAPSKDYTKDVSIQNNVSNTSKKSNKSNVKKVKKTPVHLTQKTTKKLLSIKREKTLTALVYEAYDLYQKGEYELSLSKYTQAYRQSPINQDVLLGMVATHTKLGQPDLANVYHQKLKNLGFEQDGKVTTDASKALSDRPIPPTPNLLLAQLKKTPNDAQLNFAVATLFAKQGDWQKAQNYYFKAHQFAPNNPNYAFNLAVSLEHLGHSKTALSFYKKTKNLMQVSPSSVNPMIVAKRLDVLSQHFELGAVN